MDSNTRLRVATRIHFALLRHLGDSVDVQDILHRPAQTREVLWVCEGSGDDELIALAAQFRHASRPDVPVAQTMSAPSTNGAPPAPAARRRDGIASTPQDTSWGADSSGFGVSRPPEFQSTRNGSAPAGKSEHKNDPDRERGWFKPSTWLRTR